MTAPGGVGPSRAVLVELVSMLEHNGPGFVPIIERSMRLIASQAPAAGIPVAETNGALTNLRVR